MIFVVFACGFALLWNQARDITALRTFGLSYFLGASAFLCDFLRELMPPLAATMVINSLYLATAITFSAALFDFYRGRTPWWLYVLTAGAALTLLFWYSLAIDNIIVRTIIMSIAGAAIFLQAGIALHGTMQRRPDRFLQFLLIVSGSQLILRIFLVLRMEGPTLTMDNYKDSFAALSLHFAISVAAMAIAGTLFVIFGMEIMARLVLKSETDPLTGVLNRRGFEAKIATLTEKLSAAGTDHVVVMADIDRFKAVNDSYGHEAGDIVIRAFARILEETSRDDDMIVRWGGEEFLIVMTNADTATARLYCEGLRTALEALPHESLDGSCVTASFGLAAWGRGQDFAEANRLADEALYEAKKLGRNRVCVYSPESTVGRRRGTAS